MSDQSHLEARLAVAAGLIKVADMEMWQKRAEEHEKTLFTLLHEEGLLSEALLERFETQSFTDSDHTVARVNPNSMAMDPHQLWGSSYDQPGSSFSAGYVSHPQDLTMTHRGPIPAHPSSATVFVGGHNSRVERAPADVDYTKAFPVRNWDRYQFVQFLGKGAMGLVYKAIDVQLKREVALKFVRDEEHEWAQRFIFEARAQARITHERICKVYEAGEVEGIPYIAMQYIDGENFSRLANGMTLEQKLLVMKQVAEGVHAAHRAGLIHRDLKPSNIMVSDDEEGFRDAFVMDFGLAHCQIDGDADTQGAIVGTPAYMPPEQAYGLNDRIDRRSDVYSMGATLYRTLTGKHPFTGKTLMGILKKVQESQPIPVRDIRSDIPIDVACIIEKAMEKEPENRYDSARAFANDLDRYLSGEPILAGPSGVWYPLAKKIRKHKTAFSIILLAVITVLFSTGYAYFTKRQAEVREELARSFTLQVEKIETLARYAKMAPLHDIRPQWDTIQARMEEIRKQMDQVGPIGAGPGFYALGRGAMVLEDPDTALEHLEQAWSSGFREPRVAYALGNVHSRLYQQELARIATIRDETLRKKEYEKAILNYRDPALKYMHLSRGAELEAPGLLAAMIAIYEERYDEALTHLERTRKQFPWLYETRLLEGRVRFERAQSLIAESREEEALAEFERGKKAYELASDQAQSDPIVYFSLARLQEEQLVMKIYGSKKVGNEIKEGLMWLERALTANPEYGEALLMKAELLRRAAEWEQRSGKDPTQNLEQALETLRRAEPHTPGFEHKEHLGTVYWQLALWYIRSGLDPGEYLRESIRALQESSEQRSSYKVFNRLGLAYVLAAERDGNKDNNLWRKAVNAYRKAIEANSKRFGARINLGNAYLKFAGVQRGEAAEATLDRAIETFEEVLESRPEDSGALFYLGRSHLRKAWSRGNTGLDPLPYYQKADTYYQRCIDLDPDNVIFFNSLGTVNLHLGIWLWKHGKDPQPAFDKAIPVLEKALELAPDYTSPYINLCSIWTSMAEQALDSGKDPSNAISKALELADRTATISPNSIILHYYRSRIRYMQGSYERTRNQNPAKHLTQAEQAARKNLELSPGNNETRSLMSRIELERARYQRYRKADNSRSLRLAIERLEPSLAADPENVEYNLLRAEIWLERAYSMVSSDNRRHCAESGIALLQKIMEKDAGTGRAQALKGRLLYIKAQAAPDDERKSLLNQAKIAIQGALAQNPNLSRRWKRWLSQVDQG